MSIESDLKKDGITIIEQLDTMSVNTLAKHVSEKIATTFSNLGFKKDSLFEKISKIPMYIANIPEGLSEASYFYKNSSIYFRDGMGLDDMEKFAIHEYIHNIQEVKDVKGNLLRLGLCDFSQKPEGRALNEAAVQVISSNILGETFDNVKYYDISFSTISPTYYPIICNIVMQMAYVTGENVLYDSTFNGNDNFKNKFIANCGNKTYKKILINLDNILESEEKIILLNNRLLSENLEFTKSQKIAIKINSLKALIKKSYLESQELILTSYFDNLYTTLITSVDMEDFRKSLYNYQDLIGTTDGYYFYNNYYIKMMEQLDIRYDNILNNMYLIPKKENKLISMLNVILKLFKIRAFEKQKN